MIQAAHLLCTHAPGLSSPVPALERLRKEMTSPRPGQHSETMLQKSIEDGERRAREGKREEGREGKRMGGNWRGEEGIEKDMRRKEGRRRRGGREKRRGGEEVCFWPLGSGLADDQP